MQFLKTLFWVVLAVVAVVFAMRNWAPVQVSLWGGLIVEAKLPILVFGAFLIGSGRVIELDSVRSGRAGQTDIIATPAWMLNLAQAWVIVPLPHLDRLAGAILLGWAAGKVFGRRVIVENRPGASGALAAQQASTAKPDGYTLVFASNTNYVFLPNSRKSLPYDTLKDLTGVTTVFTPRVDDATGKIEILNGRYGPYITHNKINANVPRGKEPADITLEQAGV